MLLFPCCSRRSVVKKKKKKKKKKSVVCWDTIKEARGTEVEGNKRRGKRFNNNNNDEAR